MSHRRTSSTSARSFKPSLERLEDRIVPDATDPLKQLGQQFLNDAKKVVQTSVQGLAQSTAVNLQNAQVNAEQLNRHTADFNKDPHNLGAIISMGMDTHQLEIRALIAVQQVQQLSTYLKLAEAEGAVSGYEAIALEGALSVAEQDAAALLQAAVDGEDNLDAAILAYVSGQTHGFLNEPLPHPLGSASPPPQGQPPSSPAGVTENITDAPGTASASGGKVTESVTVNNPTNSDVKVKITYSSTDGSTASASDDCTNSSVTVSLPVNPSASGNTGTWTVTVTGEPDHTNTTTFTA